MGAPTSPNGSETSLEARVEAIFEALGPAVEPATLARAMIDVALRAGAALNELIAAMASVALEAAPVDPVRAELLLHATALVEPNPPARIAALVAYARARLHAVSGRLVDADEALSLAASLWQAAGDEEGLLRSLLGKTQVLAMRGLYDEAEVAIDSAVERLSARDDGSPKAALRLAGALHNRATLFVVQDRHLEALLEYERAAELLALPAQLDDETGEEARSDLAHNALNRASALTFVDRPDEAESALRDAIARFEAAGEPIQRGRALTNLGRLHVRLGAYALALDDFAQATRDLTGHVATGPVSTLAGVDELSLRRADELPLEQAYVWLGLNLLPEAAADLEVAERLFRSGEQPYELAQTLYARGLVALRQDENAQAAQTLAEALALFESLENDYWRNRTRLALATIRVAEATAADAAAQSKATAAAELDALLTAEGWDASGRAETLLLRAHLRAALGDFNAARADAELAAQLAPALPQLQIRIDILLGRIARLAGDVAQARSVLLRAIERLESVRAGLPFEEARTAWLGDKEDAYVELLLALLAASTDDAALVSEAFAAVERARSRALLERLLVATQESPESPAAGTIADVRRRLHRLYNQLLGEEGSRGPSAELTQALRETEAEMQSLTWQAARGSAGILRDQVQPVGLEDFQAALGNERVAVLYTVAGDELLAFVIDSERARLCRNLCSVSALTAACNEMHYQLGRATLGADYVARHARRLEESLRRAFHHIHALCIAPIAHLLRGERLLFLPAGPLHGTPLHALWDGTQYLVERFEIAVAPSASLAVRQRHTNPDGKPWRQASWAGLALGDAGIPAARREVEASARYFENGALFLDDDAGLDGLRAASRADVLHLATHGLFRADNPHFSVLRLADGWVDVRSLYKLPLAARLVVLSACESGAGQVAAGEEVIGLARGFLGAGARSLVATLWHLHDESAVPFMDAFYGALTAESGTDAQTTAAAALRVAQRAAIASGQHPWYWAPYYVIGE